MTVAVITDSSACVPAELATKYGIAIVPLQLNVEGSSVAANSLSTAELRDRLKQGSDMSTSGPSPGAFLDAIEEHMSDDGVFVVTLASTMSNTHQNATLAAQQAEGEVTVLDSRSAVGGHALIALAAARAAQDGASLEEVAQRAEQVKPCVRLVAGVGSLDRLAASGRVPGIASKARDALGVWPLFEFRDGEPHVLMPSLDESKVRGRLLSRCLDSRPDDDAVLHASVLHAGHPEGAGLLLERLEEVEGGRELFVSEFDAAMMVHTGTDLLGLAWCWDTR